MSARRSTPGFGALVTAETVPVPEPITYLCPLLLENRRIEGLGIDIRDVRVQRGDAWRVSTAPERVAAIMEEQRLSRVMRPDDADTAAREAYVGRRDGEP
jgi:hypothetical protein